MQFEIRIGLVRDWQVEPSVVHGLANRCFLGEELRRRAVRQRRQRKGQRRKGVQRATRPKYAAGYPHCPSILRDQAIIQNCIRRQ